MERKIRILYDHQIYSEQEFGGISRLFTEIIKIYKDDKDIEPFISTWLSNNDYIKEDLGFNNQFFKNRKVPGKKKILKFVNDIKSSLDIIKGNFDILHPTYYDPYFLPFLKDKPFVLTVHDMTHEIYPDLISKDDNTRSLKKVLISKADRIITVSQSTKKDLLSFYDVDESKIDVIYNATSLKPTKKKIDLGLPDKYILFVGKRSGFKNFKKVVEALYKLLKKEKDLYFVCAGGGSFKDDELELLERLGVKDKVLQIQFHENDELSTFYQNALIFIFPSLYEGFGILLLEAMSCHAPLAISGTDVFKETAEDCAIYFNPNEAESIYEAVYSLYKDSILRDKIVARASKKVQEFSWKRTAEETKNVYRKILN